MHGDDTSGYLIEFVTLGNTVKVNAVDPATGTEVSIIGPVTASTAELSRIAAQKLHRALAHHSDDRGQSSQPVGPKRGIIV